MKKALKIFFIVVAVILALMIILPFAFKGKIVEAVKREANNNLNARLDFSKVSLSLFRSFPNVSVGIQDLSLTGIDDFEQDTLIFTESFRLTIDIMSVFKGSDYKVREVILQQPSVLLKVLADGRANWDIVKPSADTVPSAEDEPSTMKIALKKVLINDGTLIYEDITMPVKVIANNVDLKLSGDFTQDYTDLDTRLKMKYLTVDYDGIRYLNKSQAELMALLQVDFNAMKFTFSEAEAKVNALKLLFDGFFAMPESGYDMDIAFRAPENDFKNFLSLVPAVYTKDFESVQASGKVTFKGYVRGHYDDNSMPAYALDLLIDNGMFRYPDLPESVKNIHVQAAILSEGPDVDNTTIDVRQIHLEVASNPIDGRLYVSTPVSDPQVDMAFNGVLNLNDVQKFYPLEDGDELAGVLKFDVAAKGRMSAIDQQRYEDFDASGNVQANDIAYKTTSFPEGIHVAEASMDISPQQASLTINNALYGRNDFSVKGSIRNILGYIVNKGELKGEVDLISSYLNINDFMTESETTATAADTVSMGIIEVPDKIDISLRATAAEVIYDKLKLNQVKGLLRIKDKKITLDNLSMNTLGGSMAVSGSYAVPKPQQPDIDLNVAVNAVQAREIAEALNTVQMLAPIAHKTEGVISVNFNIKSLLGADMMPVYPTLNGDGRLTSPELAFTGVNTLNKIADVLKIKELKDWSIDKINLSFEILDGKVFVK
ncbi:MAG: AsmA-like C-terminal region-containing protein, partial [Lentimicrobiaceae bacterium]|nr:AsmA-like C-terminal region-containing protein [Lentimicrobiaceae bacterium]